MNCSGCGVELDPSLDQVNTAVDQILETSLRDANARGGVCPLCGHCKDVPYSHRKSFQFGLLLTCLTLALGTGIAFHQWRQTQREAVAKDIVARMSANVEAVRLIGQPIVLDIGLEGKVTEDETGWKESRLTVPVHGPNGKATIHVIGGKGAGPWVFTTFEIDFENEHKKMDLVSGRVTEYNPNGYVDVHTEAATVPQYADSVAAPPHLNGHFPCVFASIAGNQVIPQLGTCQMPFLTVGPVERFEADLRYGRFVLRETDLYLHDVFDVPLTRTYASLDWVHPNPVHAFGRNCNHPFDIAPLGPRNPYTYQLIALEDSDILYFDRITRGTGYADAVYQHTETATKFYKATQRWNGAGWTTKLVDGSEIHFPESYNAKNMAQGAATEIVDANGNRLELRRDAKRNLQEIRTPHGHSIKFKYDHMARVIQAEDDGGTWAHYSYNSDGMLQDVLLSSGRGQHYEYSGVLMTRIIDEKGKTLLRNSYADRFLVRQDFGNDKSYAYDYEWNESGRYLQRVRISLPNGEREEVQPGTSLPDFVKYKAR